MPSNFTEHYQLSQWEPTDKIQRTDFNADNQKIEAAIKGVEGAIPQIAVGTYTGDGQPERIIPLSFTPRMVVVCSNTGDMYYYSSGSRVYTGGFALPDKPMTGYDREYVSIVENGFKVIYVVEEHTPYTCYYLSNEQGTSRVYIAIS